jgi:adenylate cyclase
LLCWSASDWQAIGRFRLNQAVKATTQGEILQLAAAKMSVLVVDITTDRLPPDHSDDETSSRGMRELIEDLSGIARINNGKLNQTFSNGLMCAFYSADDAVVAAATMHQVMDAHTPESWGVINSPGLRIRVDTGTVVRTKSQLFGDPVRSVILMQTIAKPYQTLISETTRSYLSDLQQCQTRFVGSLPDKKRKTLVNIYEYLGGIEAETVILERPNQFSSAAAMDITYGPIVLTINAQRPRITIGRMPTNSLVLNYPRVSRYHATLERRDGKMILRDNSINGTYVRISQLGTICLKCDEMQLYGQGIICPGRSAASSSPGAIHFATR